ncbi:PAS domain-containing protein [Jannaschia sp. KMU-145]|uniref:PAS domain-containing protein n=1 Tax=Jannaschia halovivens TaxID=3388667 RepID=UPI00396B03B0
MFDELLPDSCEGTAVVHRDGRILATNDALLEGLGFAPEDDLTGLPFTSLWHHGERPSVAAAMRRARAGAEEELSLDLAYLQGETRGCVVTLRPVETAPVLLVQMDCD